MFWSDEWLTWDSSNFGDITSIRYPQYQLWLPDVIVANSVESQTQLGYKESPCVISNTGTVEWRPSEILATSCDMDVTYYPFDRQKCSIILSTWVSPTNEIDLDLDGAVNGVNLERYSRSGTWELVYSSMKSLPDEDGLSRIQYTIHLKRLSTFYVLNIIVPILLLSLTASAVFYLPAESGEKIGMGMSVLLSFAVYLTIIADNMPQTSLQVSILSVYLGIIIGICGISVVMSVFILHLHHTPKEKLIGKKTVAFIRKARKFVCTGHKHDIPRNPNVTSNNNNDSRMVRKTRSLLNHLDKCSMPESSIIQHAKTRSGKVMPLNDKSDQKHAYGVVEEIDRDFEEQITWPVVAETLDNIFFLTTSTSILILTIFIMVILLFGEMKDEPPK